MFDLDKAVSDWRQRVERTSSLSPREVDELEDHLRARVDLEMELDRALIPERAFRIAREGLGKPATMSREFAKAGMPRWRRLLAAGWAMYGVSFFLPLAGEGRMFAGSTADLIWQSIKIQDVAGLALFTLLNAPMFLTLLTLRSTRPKGGRWLRGILATMAVGVTCVGIGHIVSPWSPGMGTGYWVYAASLTCAAAAMWMRVGRWASPKPLATIKRQRG